MIVNVAVIIPAYNKFEMTRECVEETIKNAGMKCKVFVIDDHSDKPFGDIHNAKVVRLKGRSGFSKAVNVGLRIALRGDYDHFLLLNNDTLPDIDFLKHLVDFQKANPLAGIVSSVRITPRDTYMEAGLGADLTTGEVWCSSEGFSEAMQGVWAPFCSVLISRTCLEAVGLLDEKMINFCSDNDYCLRAIFMGFGVFLEPKSKVFHKQNQTVGELGLSPADDQITFARKWFGPALNEILNIIPLDKRTNKFGMVGFKTEVREDLKELIQKP